MKNNKLIFTANVPSQQNGQAAEQFWEFKNESGNTNEATLYIYGQIVSRDLEDWNWPDDVVPNKFKNELNALGDVTTIHLRINSNGGNVFAAYAIRNLLKSHKAKVIAYNDGICASAATIIATAADKVISAVGAMWLYHMPSLSMWGTYKAQDLSKIIKELESLAASMIEIYHAKTGMDKKELEDFLNEDVLISGTVAIEKGFVDEIADFKAVAYLSDDKKTAFFNGLPFDIEHIKNRGAIEGLIPPKTALQGEPSNSYTGNLVPPATDEQTVIEPENKNEMEETIVDLNELKTKYPDIYSAAKQEGHQEGVTAERERIKGIEDISLPGMEAVATKAKYESGITASEFAVAMVKAQKEKGLEYFKNAQADAKELEKVPGDPAPASGEEADAARMVELLGVAEATGKSLRGE